MRVDVVRPRDLGSNLRGRWEEIRLARGDLGSPYFAPEYMDAAAAVRPGVRIGIVEDAGVVMGFVPFERCRLGIGMPVGGRLSDFQAPVLPAAVDVDPARLVAGCGLRLLKFDHLLPQASGLERAVESTAGSPVIDLRGGFDHYCAMRGSTVRIDRLRQKERRLRRLHDVRFEFDSRETEAFDLVVQWKREQCRGSCVVDFLADHDHLGMLHAIRERHDASFAGVLSVLRIDGRVAAAHFGMRSHDTMHYWFPAYDRGLGHFSPGLMLLVEMLRAAAAAGVQRFDFGKGDEGYKRSFCTHELAVGQGFAAAGRGYEVLHRWLCGSRAALRRAARAARLRLPLRAVRALAPRRGSLSQWMGEPS